MYEAVSDIVEYARQKKDSYEEHVQYQYELILNKINTTGGNENGYREKYKCNKKRI